MVSESVNQILAAEKQAEEKIRATHKQAEAIIADANLKAESILKDGRTETEARIRIIGEEKLSCLRDIAAKGEALCRERELSIKQRASDKIQAAVKTVMAGIIN